MSLGVPRVLRRKSRLAPFLSSFRAGCFHAQTQGSAPLHPGLNFSYAFGVLNCPWRYAHQDLQISQPSASIQLGLTRRNSRTLGYVICVLASGWLGSIMSWGIPRAVGNS